MNENPQNAISNVFIDLIVLYWLIVIVIDCTLVFLKKKKKKWRKKKISCVLKKSKAQQKKKTQMYLWPCKTNEHIILHVGTNGLHSEETTSEIANSIIEIANSSKNEANTIHVSLIDPRNDNLDNKVNDANSCLTKMSRTFYVV